MEERDVVVGGHSQSACVSAGERIRAHAVRLDVCVCVCVHSAVNTVMASLQDKMMMKGGGFRQREASSRLLGRLYWVYLTRCQT